MFNSSMGSDCVNVADTLFITLIISRIAAPSDDEDDEDEDEDSSEGTESDAGDVDESQCNDNPLICLVQSDYLYIAKDGEWETESEEEIIATTSALSIASSQSSLRNTNSSFSVFTFISITKTRDT
jgi:hypothetical protein